MYKICDFDTRRPMLFDGSPNPFQLERILVATISDYGYQVITKRESRYIA